MAIIAHLPAPGVEHEVMIPTEQWEWNAIRDGDLEAGRVALIMVTNHYPEGHRAYSLADTPVVVETSDSRGWGLSMAAMRLVQEVMGVVPDSAYACHTAAQYRQYRADYTLDYASGVQRRLRLPIDSGEAEQ